MADDSNERNKHAASIFIASTLNNRMAKVSVSFLFKKTCWTFSNIQNNNNNRKLHQGRWWRCIVPCGREKKLKKCTAFAKIASFPLAFHLLSLKKRCQMKIVFLFSRIQMRLLRGALMGKSVFQCHNLSQVFSFNVETVFVYAEKLCLFDLGWKSENYDYFSADTFWGEGPNGVRKLREVNLCLETFVLFWIMFWKLNFSRF